jgi:hypothetical protein
MDLNQMAARVVRQTVEPDPPKPAETAAQQNGRTGVAALRIRRSSAEDKRAPTTAACA